MIRSDGKRSVAIYSGSWNIKENLEVIRSINQCGAKQLRLFGNRRIELVKDIEHIHFEKLILLDLWDNQINSIEALPRIHIPNLESLQIQKNRIFSIRVLRKANWSSLEFLNISENYICDHETLSHGFFANLSQLTLYGSRKKKNRKDKFMNIYFPAKLQTNCLNRLCNYESLMEGSHFKISLFKNILPLSSNRNGTIQNYYDLFGEYLWIIYMPSLFVQKSIWYLKSETENNKVKKNFLDARKRYFNSFLNLISEIEIDKILCFKFINDQKWKPRQ